MLLKKTRFGDLRRSTFEADVEEQEFRTPGQLIQGLLKERGWSRRVLAIVLRMDLCDFFPSVGAARVRALFRTAGYPHEVARALCVVCGGPLTATSANRSGEPASADPDDVARELGSAVDLMLDAGPIAGGLPSTIVTLMK